VLVHFLKIFLILIFLGCSSLNSKQEPCQETDWFELGRREGSLGIKKNYNDRNLPIICPNSKLQEQLTLYINGHNEGLNEYCFPKNAYLMGMEGEIYLNNCPQETREEFQTYFKKGETIKSLTEKNQLINEELHKLIDETGKDNNFLLKSKITKLKSQKNQNEAKLQEVLDSLSL
jgi:hypothetical protein